MTDPAQIAKGLSDDGVESLDWVRPNSIIARYRKGAREILELRLVRERGLFFVIEPLA